MSTIPNHVRTIVKINKLKKDDIDIVLNLVATCSLSPEKPEGEYFIDFNKIIPEPTTIEECPEDCRVKSAKEAHISEDEARPWFNWYKWHCTYWGTKWGAYDCYTIIGKSFIQFVFSTAWSLAYPVMQKLALMGYNIDIKYADEDIGNNCGRLTYKREQGWTHWNSMDLTNPEQFARSLWYTY